MLHFNLWIVGTTLIKTEKYFVTHESNYKKTTHALRLQAYQVNHKLLQYAPRRDLCEGRGGFANWQIKYQKTTVHE
jgi:hypothetical protein